MAAERRTRAFLVAMELDELEIPWRDPGGSWRNHSAGVSPNISQLESRRDLRVSTLRDVVAALGGTLEVRARFPDGDIRIRQFDAEEPENGE